MNRIVILAAGKGTRMNSELPKSLVLLNGKPIIKYLLDSVVSSEVDRKPCIIVSPDNQEIIKNSLKEYNLEYIIQDEPLGTGHAVACARDYLDKDTKNVLVLYGDHPFLKSESMKKFVAAENDSLIIAPTILPDFNDWHQNFYHWGRIVRGANNKVERIVELKDSSEEEKLIKEVNPGFMVFDYGWLFKNIDKLQDDNKAQEYYLTDMVKVAFNEGKEVGTINIEATEAMGINSVVELKIAEDLLNKNLIK